MRLFNREHRSGDGPDSSPTGELVERVKHRDGFVTRSEHEHTFNKLEAHQRRVVNVKQKLAALDQRPADGTSRHTDTKK